MSETNDKIDYKDTLNLPQTDFPMKGKLPEREPEFIKKWEESSLYQKIIDKNAQAPVFSMPDGPPYANGNIHIGHVLNKVLKDILVKYKNLKGFRTVFIPGWDGHGLPIEHKVTKELGSKRKDKTEKDIRELCRQEARTWVKNQGDQFRRLGILAEWEKPYVTVDADYEAEEVRELARIFDRGIIYRGEKPVHWCWALQTALAEAEVEYATHKSPSVYVKFTIEDEKSKKLLNLENSSCPISFVIWTTTPWTLPANLAIAVNEDLDYSVFEMNFNGNTEQIVIATELQESFEKETELTLKKLNTLSGKDLLGISTKHPFISRESPIVLGHHVSLDAGTGCVHTAPGHGQDDYIVGLKYNLKPYSPVDARGRYTNDVPEYEGEMIFDCNPKIVQRLQDSGHLLHHKEIKHSYPHCWRSKTPLIFRATPQWFLDVDNEKFNVRKKALKALDEVNFVPQWGESRIRAMIENRPDWCLSRQRAWGVPIPVFYCESCDKEVISSDIMMKVADDMEANNGIEAYFDAEAEKYIPEAKCSECGHDKFKKGKDILDVWFDSGICHAAVQKKRDGLNVPADIYLEGSDQHRGWFQTSLLASIASNDKAPFKSLITHGFVNDNKGRKMSKSLGNVVDPADWIKKSGAEILRLYSAYEDYGQDLTCGPEHFKRVTESYRRFRNTMRFLLGNLSGFDHKKDSVSIDDMMDLDRWMLHRLNLLIQKSTEAYDQFTFYKVYHQLNHFMTVELSATYLDILKDRLYTAKTDGIARRSAQTVMYTLTTHLSSIMAPILSFLAEETYSFTPGTEKASIFLEDFPLVNEKWFNESLDQDFQSLIETRSKVLKELEILRADKTIRSSLEAKVEISTNGPLLALLKKYKDHLPEYFIVSQIELIEVSNNESPLVIQVKKALGKKCDRCWNYNEQTGADNRFANTCPKCVEALA